MNWNRLTIVASWIAIVYAVVVVLPVGSIVLLSGDLNLSVGLLGIAIGMAAFGFGGIASARSSRIRDEQFNNLTDRLDTISSQQQESIALVKSSPYCHHDEEPTTDSTCNGTATSDEDPTKSGHIEPTQRRG